MERFLSYGDHCTLLEPRRTAGNTRHENKRPVVCWEVIPGQQLHCVGFEQTTQTDRCGRSIGLCGDTDTRTHRHTHTCTQTTRVITSNLMFCSQQHSWEATRGKFFLFLLRPGWLYLLQRSSFMNWKQFVTHLLEVFGKHVDENYECEDAAGPEKQRQCLVHLDDIGRSFLVERPVQSPKVRAWSPCPRHNCSSGLPFLPSIVYRCLQYIYTFQLSIGCMMLRDAWKFLETSLLVVGFTMCGRF